MTQQGLFWGLCLVKVSPIVRLVAVRLGDAGDLDGQGRIQLDELSGWCGAKEPQILKALSALEQKHGVTCSVADGVISFQLPSACFEKPPQSIGPARTAWIYIVRGRLGRKIGIAGDLGFRLATLRRVTLDDTIEEEWSYLDRFNLICRAERRAHKQLAPYLIRSEWFSVSFDEAKAAVLAALEESRGAKL